MKTVRATNQQVYAVDGSIPEGPVTIQTVQFRTFEMTPDEFHAMRLELVNVKAEEVERLMETVTRSRGEKR